ncbi:hypothetical protein [Persicobacter psychrovividus]|uniref:Uncharacterized protein n=1 Tax=Persicobacter psychrovividus TaxID=387638 RepID=A0ABN6LDX4_9BACT|nr:hypothetical protein PEPS_18740 [Persicobacter psychrovividus]
MTESEFKEFLNKSDKYKKAIIVGKPKELDNNVYVIEQVGVTWLTYYFERGKSFSVKLFDNEGDAFEYFAKWLSGVER